MNDLSKLSINIKLAMDALHISEARLAKATGLPQTTVNQILQGKTRNPRIDTLQSIAAELNVTIGQLIGEVARSNGDVKVATQLLAPVLEWSEVLMYLADPDFSISKKPEIAISLDGVNGHVRFFALKTSPSMEPQFRRGTFIVVEPTTVFKDHQVAVVSFAGGEPTLRKVIKDGSDLYLRKLNSDQGERDMRVDSSETLLGKVIMEIRYSDDAY